MKQADGLGFDAQAPVAAAMERGLDGAGQERNGAKEPGKDEPVTRQGDLFEHAARADPAREAVD